MRPYNLLFLLVSPVLTASWFDSPAPFTMTTQIGIPIWLAAADMNRDGVPDLVAVHSGTPLRIRGTTTIGVVAVNPDDGARIVSETPFSGDIIAAEIADFTADAIPDVLVVDRGAFGPDRLCVARGTGNASVGVILCTNLTEYADHLAIGDFNKDGQPDAAVSHPLTGQVSLWYGKPDGTFTAGPIVAVANPGVLAVADFNVDGISDIAIHSRAGRLHLLVSAAGAPLQTTQTFNASITVSSIVAGDINGDGRTDVLLCDMLSSLFTVGLGSGTAAPFLEPLVTTESPSAPRLAQLADINGDGVSEILVSTTVGMMIARIGARGSVILPPAPGFSPGSTTRFAVLDFNGDKVSDLITYTGAQGQNLSILSGQASATIATIEAVSTSAAYGQPVSLTVKALAPSPPYPLIPASTGRLTLYRGTQVLQTLPAVPTPAATAPATGPREVASARFQVTLPFGANDITAAFTDAKGFKTSLSTATRVTVEAAPSSIRLLTPTNEIPRSEGLRLDAVVTGLGAPAIGGTLKLSLNGSAATQASVANGAAQLLIPTGLPLGKLRVQLSFEGTGYTPSATQELEFIVRGSLTVGNAATYRGPLAPDSLAVAAVPGLMNTALGRLTAEIRRSNATAVPARVIYAGDNQVNLFIPPGIATGPAELHVLLDGASVASNRIEIAPVSPGLFTIGDGRLPAALAARYTPAGEAVGVPVFTCANGACTAVPLHTGGDGETLVLTVFGTGWRTASGITAHIGSTALEVLFAGPQPETLGLDQANLIIPKSLAGAGTVELYVEAAGARSNSVSFILQ